MKGLLAAFEAPIAAALPPETSSWGTIIRDGEVVRIRSTYNNERTAAGILHQGIELRE